MPSIQPQIPAAPKSFAASKSRVLELWYVKDATLATFDVREKYSMLSAKDKLVTADETLIQSGVDIGLFRLHISNADERRKFLGLKKDDTYEIMVNFSPVHLHGENKKEVLKVSYGKFFNVDKNDSQEGFTYKKMFVGLNIKTSLSFDVKLTEIDNDKVDPDPLSQILNDTSIGKVLDLSPFNPKEYVELASNIINSIQNVFGSDKNGDDIIWDDTLVMEPKPTIPGAYKLRAGIYAIVEQQKGRSIAIDNVLFAENKLVNKVNSQEIDVNYLVFGVGKTIESNPQK